MRFVNKYKHFINTKLFLKDCFFRIFKFKRSKWKKLQASLKFEKTPTKLFCNHFLVKVSYKRWDKTKSHYKDSLVLKRAVFRCFDDSLSIKYYKNILKKENLNRPHILSMLIKPLFKIDILLWKLSFFSSVYHARQAIHNNLILLNGKVLNSCVHLKCGDIITFVFPQRFKFNTTLKSLFLLSFLELDYYNNSFIVLKNFHELDSNSITTCGFNAVDTQQFIDYIKTK